MDQTLEALEAKDWRRMQSALIELPARSNLLADELLRILDVLPHIVDRFPESFVVDHQPGIVWHRYETLIWDLGEAFRQILKQNKRLRKEPQVLHALEQVTLNPKFGKGRESFVMLLGRYGNMDQVPTLKALLKDAEVAGHAVYALRLLGAADAKEAIRPSLESPKTWVRNEAKKYFQKIERQRN